MSKVFTLVTLVMLLGGCTVDAEADAPVATELATTLGEASSARIEGCDAQDVGEESGVVVSIYRIDDGTLGDLCFGMAEAIVEESWQRLSEVASAGVLEDVEVFAGFRADPEADTLAFVSALGDDNAHFVLAVDTQSAREDADELQLTVVHELAHVFTQTPDQLDVDELPEDCETLWNGLGCFRAASYIVGWIDEFWSDDALESLPADGAIDSAGGEERCLVNPEFVGSYAASHPEEDFAETFAVWVFSVEVPDAIEPKFDYLAQFPELVAMRARAIAAGLVGLPNNFDRCG